MNTVSSSANKPSKDTETSVKVPSKASTISYVNKSTEKSIPVTVSSETNTMVESSVSSAMRTGSGSSSFGSSMINKPTLVSSSMNVPATSWSKENVNGSSATTVGTTVITYSQSELPNKESNSESIISKPTANQNTTVINNNNHSTNNQGGVAVNNNGGNNAQGGQAAQGTQGSNNVENNQLTANGQNTQNGQNGNGNNSDGSNLPQTGETGASALIALGVILIVGSTIAFYIKQR